MALGSILFALAGGEKVEARYWSYIFPGMVTGMFGFTGAYVRCTTMVMGGAQEGEEGVVGAVMYTWARRSVSQVRVLLRCLHRALGL